MRASRGIDCPLIQGYSLYVTYLYCALNRVLWEKACRNPVRLEEFFHGLQPPLIYWLTVWAECWHLLRKNAPEMLPGEVLTDGVCLFWACELRVQLPKLLLCDCEFRERHYQSHTDNMGGKTLMSYFTYNESFYLLFLMVHLFPKL